jgi:putative ABC transport system substrate-binding protein
VNAQAHDHPPTKVARVSRRAFVGGLVGLGVSALAGACADSAVSPRPSTRPWRIGYLGLTPPDKGPTLLRQAMSDRGFVEGSDYLLEFRFADGKPELLPALARELVDLQVDVIFTINGITTVRAARDATQTIPIVFSNLREAVMREFAADLRRPGGNVTGVAIKELTPKRLELLKETVPGLTRLSVLGNSVAYEAYQYMREIVGYARAVGIENAWPCPFNWFPQIDDWLALIADQQPHAAIDFNGVGVYAARPPSMRKLLDFALERRLPVIYGDVRFARAGGLMSLQAVDREYPISARVIEKLLKGANPAELPVEQNDQYEVVLNLATARAIGVTFPDSVLRQATEIIP